MDEMLVRPKYSRQAGTPKKNRSHNENDMMPTLFAVKLLAVVIFLSVFALCKAAHTPLTNTLISKVKLITTENFDANSYLLGAADALGIKLPEKNPATLADITSSSSGIDTDLDEDGKIMAQQSQSSTAAEQVPKDSPASETDSGAVSSSINDTINAISQVTVLGETEIKALADKYSFVIPIKGQIESPFGIRTDPLSGKTAFHSGIDIKANMGTSIKAALDGEVIESGSSPEYNNYIKVEHNDGMYTVYAHCSVLVAKKGQKVKQGDVIAKVGDTEGLSGAYLHFEIWKGDKAADPEKLLNLLNQ